MVCMKGVLRKCSGEASYCMHDEERVLEHILRLNKTFNFKFNLKLNFKFNLKLKMSMKFNVEDNLDYLLNISQI